MRLYLDTNIWIDMILERQPFCVDAYKLLLDAVNNNHKLATSTISMVTAHFICHDRGKMPSSEILNKWRGFSIVTDVCDVLSGDIFNAYQQEWKDFEDCVQYVAAYKWNADCIITRNKKDFASCNIPVYTPEEFLNMATA